MKIWYLVAGLVLAMPYGALAADGVLIPPRQDSIRVDGLLDEPAWADAAVATNFIQQRPDTGEPGSRATIVRVMYSQSALLVGFECVDAAQDVRSRSLGRDALLVEEDYFALVLDTFLDRQNGYFFQVNPNGVRRDALFRAEGEDRNNDWDGVWNARCRVTDRGWQGEIEIPWRTLRFPAADVVAMGINFERQRRVVNEQSQWQPVDRQYSVFRVTDAGRIEGLRGIQPGRSVWVRPYVLGRVERGDDTSGGQYRQDDWDQKGDVGLDLKVGVSSELTLDLTVNTDFAQVEVDDAQVNLTRFPLFFPEKRDFFLEKRDFFNFGSAGNRLFFSRNIGLAGPGATNAGQFLPIHYGARLTGKVGRTDVGALFMETGEEGSVPQRRFGVLRASRDIGTRSRVGVMGVLRTSSRLGAADEHDNLAVGADANLRLSSDTDLSIFGAVTDDLDTSREGTDDATLGARVRVSRSQWNAFLVRETIGRDYNPAAGFVPRRGVNQTILAGAYTPEPNNRFFRRFDNHVNVQWIDRREGSQETRYVHVHPLAFTPSGAEFGVYFDNSRERLFEAFPLGAIEFAPGLYEFSVVGFNAGSDPSRDLAAEGRLEVGDFFDAESTSLNISATAKIVPHFTAETDWRHDRIRRAGPSEVEFRSDVVGLRLRFDVSNALSFNVYSQWSRADDLVLSQFRARYVFTNESDIFLVITDSRTDASFDYEPRRQEVVVKLNFARRI